MKRGKLIIALILNLAVVVAFCCCAETPGNAIGSNNSIPWGGFYAYYDRAIIELPGGESLDVQIEQWAANANQGIYQIRSKDGRIYLVHASDCILVNTEGGF